MEINVLGKGLGFMPTPLFINEADLKRDLNILPEKLCVNSISEMM